MSLKNCNMKQKSDVVHVILYDTIIHNGAYDVVKEKAEDEKKKNKINIINL